VAAWRGSNATIVSQLSSLSLTSLSLTSLSLTSLSLTSCNDSEIVYHQKKRERERRAHDTQWTHTAVRPLQSKRKDKISLKSPKMKSDFSNSIVTSTTSNHQGTP
jgi:hypothetical protein